MSAEQIKRNIYTYIYEMVFLNSLYIEFTDLQLQLQTITNIQFEFYIIYKSINCVLTISLPKKLINLNRQYITQTIFFLFNRIRII